MARFKEEPSWMSVNGYETGQIMFHSLKDVKNGKKFCESIIQNAGEISLLKGLKIDSFGDAQLPLSAFIIKNGIVEKLEGTE